MKLFDQVQGTVGGFHFSGVRPETLGAMEYTLVNLVIDKTGSVQGFEQELFQIKETVVKACLRSPRAENILLRVVEFNTSVDEVHGFMPLADIDTAAYTVPRCYGATALFDAIYSGAKATLAYAKNLYDQNYLVNAISIAVTDGDNNHGATTLTMARDAIQEGTKSEVLESMRTILIGVNTQQYAHILQNVSSNLQVDQYEDIGSATPERLARLADFISRSISTQSQALGSGGPSKPLTF